MVLDVGVQASAGGRTANAKATQALGGSLNAFLVVSHRQSVSPKLLAKPHGYGILKVRAARLNHIIKLARFGLQGIGEIVNSGEQIRQPPETAEADGGGNGVVGGLGHVDVVVGVDRLFGIVEGKAKDLIGAVGDHLVQIHIVRRTRPGLERINDKLALPSTGKHLVGGLDDRRRQGGVEQAQITVDLGGSPLHGSLRPHKSRVGFETAHRKIEHGPLGLCAVKGFGGHLHLTERIFLNAETLTHNVGLLSYEDLRVKFGASKTGGIVAYARRTPLRAVRRFARTPRPC